MWCLGEELRMNSKSGVKSDVVESDLGVVVEISQNEIAAKFSGFEGEFFPVNQAITALGLEVKNLILPERKMNEISTSSSFDGVVTLTSFNGVISRAASYHVVPLPAD